MKKLFLLFLSTFLLASCGSGNKEDSTSEKIGHGDSQVTSKEVSTNVVMTEKFIKQVDKMDNFKTNLTEAEVTEDPDVYVDTENGEEYHNVYDIDMDVTWKDEIYTVLAKIAWETDEPGGKAKLLFYSSTAGGFHERPLEVKK